MVLRRSSNLQMRGSDVKLTEAAIAMQGGYHFVILVKLFEITESLFYWRLKISSMLLMIS